MKKALFIFMLFFLASCTEVGDGRSKDIEEDTKKTSSNTENILSAENTIKKRLVDFSQSQEQSSIYYYADTENLTPAAPFICFDPNVEEQDEIYYFPICAKNSGKTIYTATVYRMNGSNEYICDFGMTYTEILNILDYFSNTEKYIVFKIGNYAYFESKDELYNESGKKITPLLSDMTEKEKEFLNLSFEEKKERIDRRIQEELHPIVPYSIPSQDAGSAVMK